MLGLPEKQREYFENFRKTVPLFKKNETVFDTLLLFSVFRNKIFTPENIWGNSD